MVKILSIIVPSYNMEKYLPKCLGSLIVDDAALLQLLDVIVVNDGSKDRTSEIAHVFAAKYPGVFRVIDKLNGNYGSCINASLQIARGEFVKVLDADDSVNTLGMAEFVRFLIEIQAPAEVDVVFTDYVNVDETDKVTATHTFPFPVRCDFGMDKIADCASIMAMHAITYRTENLRAINYRQTEGMSYTDTEWCFEPMSTVKKARYFPRVLYRYLVGREGQTVASDVMVRGYATFLKLVSYLLSRSERLAKCDGDTERYLFAYMKRIVLLVYSICFIQIPIRRFAVSFSEIDQMIASRHPDLYRHLELETFSSFFRWRYIHGLRHYGVWRLPYLLLLRSYLRGVKFIVSFKR